MPDYCYICYNIYIYKKHSSPLFICFLDASKAFDKINYWLLFDKLINRKVPLFIVKLLAFWYSEQVICVQWGSCFSSTFSVSNGVKQGGIVSPFLFNVYMNDLSVCLTSAEVGCNLNSLFINHFIYADDMCILAPCAHVLQNVLDICFEYADKHDIVYNSHKSVCMYIKSPKLKLHTIPSLYLGHNTLQYVKQYRYLGCIITDTLTDNNDVQKTIRGIYASSNMLIRKFSNCSYNVKKVLFQTCCTNFYCTQLWWICSQEALRKVRVEFNNSLRFLMGFDRYCSASVTFGVYMGFCGLIDGCSALGVVYDVSLEVVMTTRA